MMSTVQIKSLYIRILPKNERTEAETETETGRWSDFGELSLSTFVFLLVQLSLYGSVYVQ